MYPTLPESDTHECMVFPLISHRCVHNNDTSIHKLFTEYIYLDTNGAINFLTANTIDEYFTSNTNYQVTGPYRNGKPNTHATQVHIYLFCSPSLCVRFLGTIYTPRQAWIQYSGLILNKSS